MRRTLSVLLAASFMVAAPAIVPAPVQAQSLLENLFPRAAERRRERLQRRYERQIAAQRAAQRAAKRAANRAKQAEQRAAVKRKKQRRAAPKIATVKAPTFKTYVANPVRKVDLARLAPAFRKAEDTARSAQLAAQEKLAGALAAKGYSLDSIAEASSRPVGALAILTAGAEILGDIEVEG